MKIGRDGDAAVRSVTNTRMSGPLMIDSSKFSQGPPDLLSLDLSGNRTMPLSVSSSRRSVARL